MTPAVTSAVRLSARVQSIKPSATFAVNARVKALRAEGKDVIGFGTGEPDFRTPDHVSDAAVEALRSGMTGYQPVPGTDAAREVIASKLRSENGIECTASDIVITVGGKSAMYFALQAIVDPGRTVLLPTPCWVSYRPMVELAGGVVREIPGAVEADFRITAQQLEDAITPDTCAIVLNSPSNPCGTMYSPEDLRAFGDVLARHEHIWVISDEIYEKLIYGDEEHFSLGSLPALRDRVITVNGLSKAYAMTGWRLGYACAPGMDGAVAKAIAKLQGQVTSHATSFTYPAIVEAITHGDREVAEMRAVFAQRAERIYRHMTAIPDVVCPKPTGAFYVFPDIRAFLGRTSPGGRELTGSVALAEALLEEALVAVVPGEDFGECAKTHLRLSFACSDEQIDEGCRRIADWLGRVRSAPATLGSLLIR